MEENDIISRIENLINCRLENNKPITEIILPKSNLLDIINHYCTDSLAYEYLNEIDNLEYGYLNKTDNITLLGYPFSIGDVLEVK